MSEVDFQGRLLPSERMIWSGAPPTGFLLTSRDIFLVPFSLFWCGFTCFWMWSAMTATYGPYDRSQAFSALFGIPFVLVGLYMLLGRFVADAWIRSHTCYAVTNQRVLILRTSPTFKFTAYALDRLPELSLDERRDGRGTIRFQPSVTMSARGNGSGSWTPGADTSQFLLIPDARNVFDRIQRAAKAPS